MELSQLFARFGAAVTIIELADRLLAVEEPESGQLLGQVFGAEGIDVRVSATAEAVRHSGGRFTVELAGGPAVTAERLLAATGRQTHLDRLGVGAVGLDPSARYLAADDRLRVAPGVWAVGDIVGRGAFTHLSMYHADIVIESARGWIHKAGNDGFVKLVADAGRGVLVGATSAGPAGGEALSLLTLAVHAAIPVRRLSEMIYAYPTFHRAVLDAVRQLL